LSKKIQNPNPSSSETFIVRRGKERETPKKRKITKLKQVILLEREQVKEQNSSTSSIEKEEPTESQEQTEKKLLQPPSYCQQIITDSLNTKVTELLKKLRKFEEKQKANLEGKYGPSLQENLPQLYAKRRMICGLREVGRAVEKKKVKCIIIAADIEQIDSGGGLNEMICNIIKMCNSFAIPVVYALCKSKIGKAIGKHVKVSCLGVVNMESTEDIFKQILQQVNEGKKLYLEQSNVQSVVD